MARFEIKSKDGSSIRYSGKPRYNGSYLKPAFIEFSEISSPTPISWEVGDYLDYSRTGMRYYLYSIPQPSKNARKGASGKSFTYSNVQLFAATKEIEIALFKDLVSADNNIHFSTSPDVATFEDVYGIARRIQACMDYFYPNRWEIRIADFDETADAEIIERIATAKDFALSNGTCLDALSKIYELWQDIGWIHTNENGKEIIIIGYPNKRISANTTEKYLYGKGNGLTAIKKNQTNKDEFATRLYVYGSERNLPARYYNGLDILNAESVDIRNLMLPLERWGKTDGLPDARKAYLENAEAVAKYGLIPKTHYFDSEDAGADIYPSIEGMTIGHLRKVLTDMGQTEYFPTEAMYPNPLERVDEVRFCYNPTDDGELSQSALQTVDKEYTGMSSTAKIDPSYVSQYILDNLMILSHTFTTNGTKPCEVKVSPKISGYVKDAGFSLVKVSLTFRDSNTIAPYNVTKEVHAVKEGDNWEFSLPSISYDYAKSPLLNYNCYVYISIEVFGSDGVKTSTSYTLNEGSTSFGLYAIQDKTFTIRLKEIGFNIDEMALRGKGKTISMKTGMCAGRNFEIVRSRHKTGYWDITCKRQQDDTLGMLFPNSSYEIASGDRFVLVDIAMPESYIRVAQERLLEEGIKLLSRASKIQNHYEPSIDAKVMIESGRGLREGMFMEITDEDVVDNTTDYILIDTLSIYEDESAIPTYKVTLRERRKVTYKGTPSATSTTDTKSVEDDTDETTSAEQGYWHLDSEGNLVTDRQVIIRNNLIVHGDSSSGGEGSITPGGGGIVGIKVNGTTFYDTNADGIIDLGTISGGGGISQITSQMVIDALGYTPVRPTTLNNFLPKTGGQLTGALQIFDHMIYDDDGAFSIDSMDSISLYAPNDIVIWSEEGQLYFNDKPVLTEHQSLAGYQPLITDLATIRSGASLGATAVQPATLNNYATNTALSNGLATKQNTISDLATIRSGAALGASAVQPATLTSALAGYLPLSGGTLSGPLTVNGAIAGASTIQANSVICGTARLRVNASTSAGIFAFMDARPHSSGSNRSTAHIGSAYGNVWDIANISGMVAISIYKGSVGVGREFTDAELKAASDGSVGLTVAGNQTINGNLVVTGDISA